MSIDYAKAQRQFRAQKTALTKAINKADAEAIVAATTKAVKEWEDLGSWPDHWHRWQRALDDAFNIARSAYIHRETSVKPNADDFDIDAIRRKVVLSA